jgi:hypothetical protein
MSFTLFKANIENFSNIFFTPRKAMSNVKDVLKVRSKFQTNN